MTSQTTHRRVAAATVIVMVTIFLSRILGFLRDWAVAHLSGANSVTDTYNTAFTLPDILNYLIAGGALSFTFIPVFAKYVAKGEEEEGWRVFSTVVSVMGFVLVGLVVLGELLAVPILRKMEPGFNSAELARTVFLTRLMLPAQIFFYEGSILAAVQYAKGQFLIPSLAPVIYNLSIILGGVLLHSQLGIAGFSVGVVAGAILGNFLLQIYGASRVGAVFTPNLRVKHPGFVMFLKMSVPIMLALGLAQADDWIIRHYASYLELAEPGVITWLTYGKKLMQVPLGFVGQAIGVASFPLLAQFYSEGKYDEVNRLLNSTFKALIFLLLPISALMIGENQPLVHVLFMRTRFVSADFIGTGAALVYFSLGLVAWGSQSLLARGFYATRNTVVPAVVGTITTAASIPFYLLLMRAMQHRGLALASSLGIAAYTVVLFVLLARRTQNHEVGAIAEFFAKVCTASVFAAAGCYEMTNWLAASFPLQHVLNSLFVLVVDSLAGCLLLWILLKVFRVREVDSYLRRGIAMITRSEPTRA